MVLEKTLESPLDYKEVKPVNPKGNQSLIFIGRTDAEVPIFWPPDVKSQLIGKVPDAGKDWGQEEKGVTENEMVRRHHWLNEPLFEKTLKDGEVSGNVWREDSYVLSLMSPLSLFKWNSMLLPGTEVIVWGRLGSPLVNILFRTKLLSLAPVSWDMDCLLTLWLTLPLVPLVIVAVRLVSWSLAFPKEVSCTTAYIYS